MKVKYKRLKILKLKVMKNKIKAVYFLLKTMWFFYVKTEEFWVS